MVYASILIYLSYVDVSLDASMGTSCKTDLWDDIKLLSICFYTRTYGFGVYAVPGSCSIN